MPDLPPSVYLPLATAGLSVISALALAVRILYKDQRADRQEMIVIVTDSTAALKEAAAGTANYAKSIDRLTERLDRAA